MDPDGDAAPAGLEEAPLGQADLLAWPEGRGLWPVGPLIDALHTPLTWLFGDSLAMALVGVLLLTLAGLGPAVLARVAGAGTAGALAAGAMVQLSPYLLTNLDQMVIELGAIGVAALAAAAILHALRGGPWWPALVGIGATTLCSPYYALFLALGCALTLPVVRTRRWLPIATRRPRLAGGLVLWLHWRVRGGVLALCLHWLLGHLNEN